MNPFELTGKTVLVTGATSGLGRQSAISASQMGARVIVTGRDPERLAATLSNLHGANHLAFPADLTKDVERDAFTDQLPPLDGIVHSAGIAPLQPFGFNDLKLHRETYCINVEAPLFVTQRLFRTRKLNQGASLVFIASIAAFHGALGHSIYAGSKAALTGLVRVLARELSRMKIRANCISPAAVKTELIDALTNQVTREAVAADEALYPLGYGTPEDVANAVVYFLSPASRWVTGTNFIMDGGLT